MQSKSRHFIFCCLLLLALPVQADFKAGGDAYKRGDYETALQEFLAVAKIGDHRAMYALGSMYSAGHGVERDLREAFRWFQRAARYGRPDAEYKIGLMYAHGLGVERNYTRALNWYDKAAKKGFGSAHYQIGLMYLTGRGVKQSYLKAHAWSQLAVDLGDQRAGKTLAAAGKHLDDEERQETLALQQSLREQYVPARP